MSNLKHKPKYITTQCGQAAVVVPGAMPLSNNDLGRLVSTDELLLIHRAKNSINLIFDKEVEDWAIQGVAMAIDKMGEQLPIPVRIKNIERKVAQ